jgi:acetyl-CoA carboxylase carboxyl transferase subunit alpha
MKMLPFEKPVEILYKELKRRQSKGYALMGLDELIDKQIEEVYKHLTPYDIVLIARHPDRPQPQDYIEKIFASFTELHGDRVSGDDESVIGGLGFLEGNPVMVIGTRKGHNVKETLRYHSGMIEPSGFRKIARLVKLASNTLHVPVITFIDTPGAMVSPRTEVNGQVSAIYSPISALLDADVPVISVITGEGGSLAALSLSISDRLLMLKYSFFAVLSPEAASAVLFKDLSKKREIAKALQLTADELSGAGIADRIIDEPAGAAHRYPDVVIKNVRDVLSEELEFVSKEKIEVLKQKRGEKFRKVGVYSE